MGFHGAKSRLAGTVAAALAALVVGACGDSDAGNPESELNADEAAAPLEGAPAPLVAVRDDANLILEEGLAGFEERLAQLEGIPVVVNKWASWCGPCREEFPYFQAQAMERGDEVAFLGLLSNDGVETGATFLGQLPLPYPSYHDPDLEIADELGAGRAFPATVFIDSGGEIVYTKPGPYVDEAALAADIDRYASG